MILPRVVMKVSMEVHYPEGTKEFALGIDSEGYSNKADFDMASFRRGILSLLHCAEFSALQVTDGKRIDSLAPGFYKP